MNKILHLSDLHFGTEREDLMKALLVDIDDIKPDIVVISGDLTQRAKNSQYETVKQFLGKISYPILCVPGNHDISLYNIIERLFYPYSKYKKFINPVLCHHFSNDDIAILGINSVTPYKIMGGYVTDAQLQLVKDFFNQQIIKDKIKIIVMHHNLVRSERHKIINDAEKIIEVFASCNVNLVLSGHLHLAKIETLKNNYSHHPMYIITAGTAISTRTLETNSYNLIEFRNNKQFKFIVKSFTNNKFVPIKEEVYAL